MRKNQEISLLGRLECHNRVRSGGVAHKPARIGSQVPLLIQRVSHPASIRCFLILLQPLETTLQHGIALFYAGLPQSIGNNRRGITVALSLQRRIIPALPGTYERRKAETAVFLLLRNGFGNDRLAISFRQ